VSYKVRGGRRVERVQGACDEFFAGAGFAGEEHDAEVRGDAFELGADRSHGRAFAGETGIVFKRCEVAGVRRGDGAYGRG
jgi:hypothetical protein